MKKTGATCCTDSTGLPLLSLHAEGGERDSKNVQFRTPCTVSERVRELVTNPSTQVPRAMNMVSHGTLAVPEHKADIKTARSGS